MKARIISYSTTILLTLTLTTQSFAAGAPFKDLADVSAKDKILWLKDEGYVNGTEKDSFAPKRFITGAESIQLFVNAFQLNLDTIRFVKEPKATDYFKKADNFAWYAQALIIAGVRGFELSNDLDPRKEWTRELFTYQLTKAMENYGKLPMIKLVPTKITDANKLTIEYSGAIQRALSYGVCKLDADGNFNPKGKISREEAAEQVYNALQYIKVHPAP